MDQDDSMLSTPSSNGNDDTLYDEVILPTDDSHTASYVAAQVPLNDHLNASAPGELSPPRSQSISNTQANGFGSQDVMDPDDGEMMTDEDEAIDVKADRSRRRDEDRKPGAGWKNKKAQEDMQRSWEYIVDKDYDVKQFGDVLAGKQKK